MIRRRRLRQREAPLELGSWALYLGLLALFGYIFVAHVSFSFRHPWMTQTEKLLYIGDMLTFGRVDYEAARPRDSR